MITAEISNWSVVFYGSGECDSRGLLRRIYDTAVACKIGAGSVGVFDSPRVSNSITHVDLLHCDKDDALRVLQQANIAVTDISFQRVRADWDTNALRCNRRRRLRGG